jgi:hypothetical protein
MALARENLSTVSVGNWAQNIPGRPNFPWIRPISRECLNFRRICKTLFLRRFSHLGRQITENLEGFAKH